MSIKIKELDNAPIVMLVYGEPFTPNDIEEGLVVVAKLAEQGKHIHVINDLSQLSVNFGDMMLGMSRAASAGPGGPADSRTTHYLVGGHELIKFIADAGQQDQYGQLAIEYSATVDEALATARSRL